MVNKKDFHIVSLGCAKNSVDSDSMAQLLENNDYNYTESPDNAGVIIVNTCGFIDPAKDESFSTLKELSENKQPEQLLIAAGCLTQRYGQEVAYKVPGVDGILGTRNWIDIVLVVQKLRAQKHPTPLYHLPDVDTIPHDDGGTNRVSIQGTSAYIKIADGCRRPCAFCAIPLIKGTAVSRPINAVIADATTLQQMGMREIMLIAQDTTDYGHDLGIKNGLAVLLRNLVSSTPDIDWIRLLYAYPGYVTDELIEVMAEEKQVLPYLDIPLQHADPMILRTMRRPANMEWVHKTIGKLRNAMPEITIRTTFIVGYPGETEKQFQSLLDFIKEIRFDKVGAFQYSFESGTTSEALGDPVPADVKQERWDRLMELQQGISKEINLSFVGRNLDVLIEGQGDNLSIGRTYRDAPEIDGLVLIENSALPIGDIVPIRITGAFEYDLTGVPLTTRLLKIQ